MSSENNCTFVSSRGILKSCDTFSNTPMSSIPELINYNKDLSNLKDGTIIYICNSAVKKFLSNIKNIQYRFILVSGDSDTTVPNDIFPSVEEFLSTMQSDKLIHWYAQNCIVDHAKLTRLPIGLDYHTLSEQNYKWGPQQLPINQERGLNIIKDDVKPFWKREIKCYSNFHFSFYRFGYDRKDAIEKIPKDLIFYEKKEIPRMNSWLNQSKYAFVVSPHGNGLDCHRTWEAFTLGCIVIVKTSGLDPLYHDLPVLIVQEWSDITNELLINTVENYKNKKFNYNKLKLDYWVNQITNM